MIKDEKIVELFFARSERAIQELDIKYGRVCQKLSYNIVNNSQDAEECVTDAYLGAWNAIPPAKPDPLQAYICKIVRNISLKLYYRKEAAKRNSVYEIAMQELEDHLPAPNTVEAEIEARELAGIINSFLETLTVENRVIFMSRYAYMDTYSDIAAHMGMSENNVAVRLKATGVEHIPHFGGSIRRFFPCLLRLAPARLHQPKQKSLEYSSPKCACSFYGADFCPGKTAAAGNTLCIPKADNTAWAEIRP